MGVFGSLHLGKRGPWDAGSGCLVPWPPSRAWLRSCKTPLWAWLRRNARFGRFSSAWLAPASARARAWRFRPQGDGVKMLGLPPPFPPFTAYISPLPPPPSHLLCRSPSTLPVSSSPPLPLLLFAGVLDRFVPC
jgi:hypothetical protein